MFLMSSFLKNEYQFYIFHGIKDLSMDQISHAFIHTQVCKLDHDQGIKTRLFQEGINFWGQYLGQISINV